MMNTCCAKQIDRNLIVRTTSYLRYDGFAAQQQVHTRVVLQMGNTVAMIEQYFRKLTATMEADKLA